jgi:hypothetical protein
MSLTIIATRIGSEHGSAQWHKQTGAGQRAALDRHNPFSSSGPRLVYVFRDDNTAN